MPLTPKRLGRYQHELEEKVKYKDQGELLMTNLAEIKSGKKAEVVKINVKGQLGRHLMDMGIHRGTEITVRKVAPLGDPIEVTVRGYELSLRKSEAENIEVKEL